MSDTTPSKESAQQQSFSQQEYKLRIPQFCILRIPIQECTNVSGDAKVYFGQLSALEDSYFVWGDPFNPTDEMLSEMKGVSLRTIQRWNKELEDNGFISRIEVDGEGRVISCKQN